MYIVNIRYIQTGMYVVVPVSGPFRDVLLSVAFRISEQCMSFHGHHGTHNTDDRSTGAI